MQIDRVVEKQFKDKWAKKNLYILHFYDVLTTFKALWFKIVLTGRAEEIPFCWSFKSNC